MCYRTMKYQALTILVARGPRLFPTPESAKSAEITGPLNRDLSNPIFTDRILTEKAEQPRRGPDFSQTGENVPTVMVASRSVTS